MELGAQEFKGELRKEGRPSPTLPSVGRREFFEVEPSLRSQVTLLQTSRLRKGLFPFRQTRPFGGIKSAEPVTAPEELPHTTENWQLYREQTSTTVPALPSLRTPRPPPLLTPASPESNKLGSYRETQATSLQGEQVAPSIPATESAPSARTATNTPPPESWETRTNSPVEMGAQVTESYKKRGREYVHTRAPVRETSPVITEQSSKTVLATNAIEDQMKMRMRTHVQGMEGRGAVPTTEGLLPVASESTKAGYPVPEAFGTQATNVTEVGGGKEAPSLPREGGGEVASTPWSLETQTISTPESATGIPLSLRKAGARTEQTEAVNLSVTEVVHGQFLEAQTKTTPRAVVGLQGTKSHGTQGRVFTPIEGTKATYVMSSPETAEAPVTNPHTGTVNTTGVGASLQDTSYVLNRSIEMKAQEAASLHGKEGGHPYTTTPAGTWPVMSESEHLGRPTERTPVQETQSLHPPGRGATETASVQTKAQNLSNTEEGTSIARTVPEAVHSTSVALLLETLENQTLRLGEVAMKEETSSYGEEGGLTTTHLLPSFTLSTETAEQGQSTHVRELILPENWPTGHPELGTGKHPTNKTQTGEEHTSLISMGELPSLESEPTKAVYPTEGTSLLQASPRQTFSPIEQQITTTNSQETPAEIFPREEPGQSPMSPGGVQSAETEASGLLGLLTLTTSTWPPETPAQRLEEVSEFHGKRGRGKPTPLPTGTAWPAENETYMVPSTKIALGMEALEGQTTSQTVLGITEVSLAQLLGGSTPAERASFPGAEVTEAVNPVPSNGTETQTTLPNKTREVILTARTRTVGTEAIGQSYSTTMKAMGTPSSPSERMLLYTATSGHRKKNGGQAYTHPLTGSMSPAGSNTTRTSSSLGLPYYQTALASTEPMRTRLESGVQSAAGEMVPTSIGFSLETQTASSPAEGNGRESKLSTYGGITPVGRWGLRHETYAPEWHGSQSEKWTLHTTTLAKSELPTPPAESQGARTATNSVVGGTPTAGKGKAQGMKVIQLKRAFRKPPSALSAVDPEILHLVGKRSLPDAVARPAPPQDGNPALKGTTLSHGQTGPELHSLLLSNPPEKQRAKALEALLKQHFLLPGFQVSPVPALSPTAKAFKGVPWWRGAGTSGCALDRKCGLFRPKEHLLGRKKAINLAPFLMSAKAVRSTAPRGMDKPIAAPLPRDQSGPGKRGHSIRTTPKATVESGLLEWQVCDFEEDLCSWQQSDTDDFDWIRAGERPARSLPGGNISDPRASPSGGNYISLRSPSARQTPGQKTALISPVLHGIGCIRFWYSPLGSAMGTINLYIKHVRAPEWHRIWTAQGTQGTEWHPVGVAASESQKLQVMVEGVIGPEAGSDAGIDDLSVCAAECQGGCEVLFAWYKK
ncbi:astacin-like metalloendopeptidase isoform X2 [Emydura macquarii macquarii]|uniref:astacin-like metalloendopeptidase isoform X2 n=1 Tax=Emydura macquarii macquarii TaxID=1129001 RepID=UPI00352AC638